MGGVHFRVSETSVVTSPPADSSRTRPTPFAYHFVEVPDSSIDHSLVRTQFVKAPKGTVTVSSNAHKIGRMHLERWQTLVRQLEEIQVIDPNSVKAESSFTTEFLPVAE